MKKILLIDDDPIFNVIHKRTIENATPVQQIYVSNSATEALELLKDLSSHDDALPELILLDIQMPVMNGFEFLEEFEKLPQHITEKIKIAMLTSSLEESDSQHAFKYKNVVEFINKPFSAEKLNNLKAKIR